MWGDRQLSGPVPGHRLADYPVHRRPVHRLLLQQETDKLPEFEPLAPFPKSTF
jgi:hypothetical protein